MSNLHALIDIWIGWSSVATLLAIDQEHLKRLELQHWKGMCLKRNELLNHRHNFNRNILLEEDSMQRSFIQRIQRKGRITDRCGMPLVTAMKYENQCSMIT